MALVFPKLTFEGIMDIAKNHYPECELTTMSPKELEVLIKRVDKIVKNYSDEPELYAKLMRLKLFAMLQMN